MPSADPPADSSRADRLATSDSATSDSPSSDSASGDATSRRRLLGIAGAALSTGLAGCAGGVRAPASADDGPACSKSSASHSAPAFPDGWPLYGYDSRNTGSTPNASGPVEGAEIDWVDGGSGAIWGTPVVAGDAVYVQPSPTRLVAVSRERGERRWSLDLGVADESKSTRSHSGPHLTPAVVGDTVYAVGGEIVVEPEEDGMGATRVANHVHLSAVDRRSGEIRWTVQPDHHVVTAPVVAGDTVLFATLSGTVYAVDAERESVAWTLSLDGFEPPAAAAPAVDGCRCYLPTVESGLYAVDAERGELDWHLPEIRSFAPPAVADGLVYVGGSDGTVYAVDPESASQGESASVEWEYDAGRAISTASPAVASGTVFVGDADGDGNDERARVQALDAETGEEVWTAETREYVNSSPAVADGVLYAAAEGTVYAFDAASGNELWRYELPVGIRTPLSVVDGRLYAATLGGDLYAFAEEE